MSKKKEKEYVFVLYGGDNYVDLDGSTEEDEVLFHCKSLESLNKKLQEEWYEMPFDTRGLKLTEDKYRIERKCTTADYPYDKYIYYAQQELH